MVWGTPLVMPGVQVADRTGGCKGPPLFTSHQTSLPNHVGAVHWLHVLHALFDTNVFLMRSS